MESPDVLPSQNNPIVSVSQPERKKKKWILYASLVMIVAVAIFLLFFFKKHTPLAISTEMINLTYKIELENGTIIAEATEEFPKEGVGSGLGFVSNKIDKEISMMKRGETKTLHLNPEDAYGNYDNKKIYTYERIRKQNRTVEINRTIIITKESFEEAFGETPLQGKTYESPFLHWPYKVLEINETHVKLSQEPKLNQKIPSGFFSYLVFEITQEKIKLKLEGNNSIIPTENGNYEIKFTEEEVLFIYSPKIGQQVQLEDLPRAYVKEINETHIILDANHPYAGKKVIVTVTINDIYRGTITGKATYIPGAPTLQLFIMSYCPYGIQALKGLIPVWEKFEGKANIELRFVSYVMHGKKEEEENNRMICIREEQYSKLLPYIKCFVEAGKSEECVRKVGIDKNKLDSCIASRAEKYMEEDKALNEKYNVRGSPTFIINERRVNIYPRDPQSIANALCDSFSTKPNVCNEKFSTENPSPGFGFGTSNSGVGGSCG